MGAQRTYSKRKKKPPLDHEGTIVFSKAGFVTVGGKEKNATSEYISHDMFILEGINRQIFSNNPFFKKFQMMQTFKQWK